MLRMPLASASLLAIAISLAGCGEDKAPATQAAAPAASSTSAAAVATGQIDQAAGKAVVSHYADLALAVFSDAASTGKNLQAAIDALLATPNDETLKAAREAWLVARAPYMQSEVFRFGNAVVDDWEGQLNAWPLDEGLIDYVAKDYQHALGNPGSSANIIANTELQVGEDKLDVSTITPELLASLNELGGSEANVATGYHAIEFLLWGQDLEAMVAQWQAGKPDNYRATLEAESVENGLRKMLFGMGSLSLGELAGERMKVALEANSTEDEHDCFSDNTHNSHFYNGKGIRNVYLGEYKKVDGTTLTGPSLSSLVAKVDAAADSTLKADLEATEGKLQALVDSADKGQHFDQLIAADNTAGQQIVRDAIAALVKQTGAIEQAAGKLGISDLNPDTADHSF